MVVCNCIRLQERRMGMEKQVVRERRVDLLVYVCVVTSGPAKSRGVKRKEMRQRREEKKGRPGI